MFIILSCLMLAGNGLNYLCSQCIDKDGLLLASMIYGSFHNTVLHFTQHFAVLTWKEVIFIALVGKHQHKY